MSRHAFPLVAADRRRAIEEMVTREGFAQVVELARHFGRDSSTIRRDLELLEDEGRLRRTHGGAVPAVVPTPAAPAGTTEAVEGRIARALAETVRDGETICLGPGRIPLATARALATRPDLTIITNSLEIAHWLAVNSQHNLIVTGGQLERGDLGLAGQLARTSLSGLRAERAILEAAGVSAVEGVTDDSLSQAEIAQILLETASEIAVAVPPEKVGRVAAVHVAPVSDVDIVVTAREARSSHLWDLSELGVRIILA